MPEWYKCHYVPQIDTIRIINEKKKQKQKKHKIKKRVHQV